MLVCVLSYILPGCFSDLRILIPRNIIICINEYIVLYFIELSFKLISLFSVLHMKARLQLPCSSSLLLCSSFLIVHNHKYYKISSHGIFCILLCPKSSWKELNRDAWKFWGKELWCFVYSVLLHGKLFQNLSGQPGAWLGICTITVINQSH